jgi:hypothetical protein
MADFKPSGSTSGTYYVGAVPGSGAFTDIELDPNVLSIKDARQLATYLLDRIGGLGSLAPALINALKAGETDSTRIMDFIRQQPAYAERFSGNIARKKAGLPTLGEAEYLNLETNYRKAMSPYLPGTFYDKPADFAKFIAADISADELAGRAKTAYEFAQSKDPATKEAFKKFYNIESKDLAAYFLDPKRAMPLLESRAKAAAIGAEATRSGIDQSVNAGYLERLSAQGLDQSTARQVFGQVATSLPTLSTLANIEGDQLTTRQAIEGLSGISQEQQSRITGLASRERARFKGSSGGTQILGTDMSGSF